MISKFNGTCRYCQIPTKAGVDEYDIEAKTSYHARCVKDEPPSAEDFAKAERLGFVASDEDSIRAMAGRWVLWNLREADRSNSTGRTESEAQGNANGNLFGVSP